MAHLQDGYTWKMIASKSCTYIPSSRPLGMACLYIHVLRRHGITSYMDFSSSIVSELVDENAFSSHGCTKPTISDDTKSECIADGMQGLEAAGSCLSSDLDAVSVQRAAIINPSLDVCSLCFRIFSSHRTNLAASHVCLGCIRIHLL